MERVAIVTGGASGIGAATAVLLRAAGWRVISTGLTEKEVDAAGPDAVRLDVRNADAVAELFAGHDRLDGLVNAAGIAGRGDQTEMSLFEEIVDVNLTGTMRCCVAAHSALAEAGGSVVNLASVLGFVANPTSLAYAASKAGVVNLTRALAARWAEDGIRVNAVAPGYIETPMTDFVRADNERADRVMAHTPMGRWGKPEEIAELIVWLMSDKASFVTGSTHLADGGYCAV